MSARRLALIGMYVLVKCLTGPSHAQSALAPEEVAPGLSADIRRFVAELDAETEDFAVRINRCEGRLGEFSDQIYYVWVGWRGIAAGTAGKQLVDLRSHWSATGWQITRDRALDNGGINLAAIEPVTGNTYSLDSGFEVEPDSYIVGYFHSPCFFSPTGPVQFGPWHKP
ncbi:hypothetical protein QEZ48_16185 [Aquamicrobium lusatiense]|uniref:hypothetical protein n=1 Tax=Aquamicrobium lusatiense TaxID=89772 RepID=UPI00245535C2|nr:hypothetical protein [Aquamicrobium lusatiense]MDH4992355.1 hypothetical protein [Aquamicrobium lusatiense]